jgi:hypothetical protein
LLMIRLSVVTTDVEYTVATSTRITGSRATNAECRRARYKSKTLYLSPSIFKILFVQYGHGSL